MFILGTPSGLWIAIRYGRGLAIRPKALFNRLLVNCVRIVVVKLRFRSGMGLMVGITGASKFSVELRDGLHSLSGAYRSPPEKRA